MHPYVADQVRRARGIFGKRLVAGAFVFSAGLGAVGHHCVSGFRTAIDKLPSSSRCHRRHDPFERRTHLEERAKYERLGIIRASYQVFKGEGELVMYCEHLQTVKYRDASAFARCVEEGA